MRLDTVHSLVIVLMVALATQITRWTPFLLMGLLVVYSLRSVDILSGSHGLPEAIAVAATALLHLWKRNTLVSILAGTAVYMLLVQLVFA